MFSVLASLKYLTPQPLYQTEKLFEIFVNIAPDATDQRTTNLIFENVLTSIEDVRGKEKEFTLDKNGFMFVKAETKLGNERSREDVESLYLKEVEELLKMVEGVDRIFVFDWRLRNMKAPDLGGVIDLNNLANWLRRAVNVHVDQSPSAVLNRIKTQFGDEASELLRGRVRVINVWRPLVKAVQGWPLAVCDGSTVREEDLVETGHVRKRYTGSTLYLMHNPAQRFLFMSAQGRDDVLIFRILIRGGVLKGNSMLNAGLMLMRVDVPHASFEDLTPSLVEGTESRESIEVRAIVFYSSQDGWLIRKQRLDGESRGYMTPDNRL